MGVRLASLASIPFPSLLSSYTPFLFSLPRSLLPAPSNLFTNPSASHQMFNTMVDGCFVPCVDDFTSKALSGRETGCLTRCVAKNFAATGRLSERFAEQSAAMQQSQAQGQR